MATALVPPVSSVGAAMPDGLQRCGANVQRERQLRGSASSPLLLTTFARLGMSADRAAVASAVSCNGRLMWGETLACSRFMTEPEYERRAWDQLRVDLERRRTDRRGRAGAKSVARVWASVRNSGRAGPGPLLQPASSHSAAMDSSRHCNRTLASAGGWDASATRPTGGHPWISTDHQAGAADLRSRTD